MAKKPKSFFGSYSEFCKAWVAKTCATDAHTDKSRMYSDGDTVYSYGRHFPLARRFTATDTGNEWYLLNDNSHSQTTHTHQREIRHAIANAQRISLDRTRDHELFDGITTEAQLREAVLEHALFQMRELRNKFCRTIKPYGDPDAYISHYVTDNYKKLALRLPPECDTMRDEMWAHYRHRQEREKILSIQRRLVPNT